MRGSVMARAVVLVALLTVALGCGASKPESDASDDRTKLLSQLERVDGVIAPDGATMLDRLRQSGVVEAFAPLPEDTLYFVGGVLGEPPELVRPTCATRRSGGFAVQLNTPDPEPTIKSLGDAFVPTGPGTDLEVYMEAEATEAATETVRDVIADDGTVADSFFMNRTLAVMEFRRMFRDQPKLLNDTPAEALPVSFRLTIADNASLEQTAERYEEMPSVSSVRRPNAGAQLQPRHLGSGTDPRPSTALGELFLDVDATSGQVADVRAALESDSAVSKLEFLDRDDAQREFERLFHDQPELVEQTSREELPESFRFEFNRSLTEEGWDLRYEALGGVSSVIIPDVELDAQCD